MDSQLWVGYGACKTVIVITNSNIENKLVPKN